MNKPDSALVIAGHGSSKNPDSSAPTYRNAEEIRSRGIFSEVACAFWMEEPAYRDIYRTLQSRSIYIVPNFISEGFFTREIIPREFQLESRTTVIGDRRVHYCDPVGSHPSMTGLLLKRAREVAPGVPPEESSLLIVGHGTKLNPDSRKAVETQVERIRKEPSYRYAEVEGAFMEEPPLISDWQRFVKTPNVIVVPFFIADGLHSYQEIPVLLGIDREPTAAASQREVFRQNPHRIDGRDLYYATAIGTDPALANVILDQVSQFDAAFTGAT